MVLKPKSYLFYLMLIRKYIMFKLEIQETYPIQKSFRGCFVTRISLCLDIATWV